jgi:phage baseplate assembly protein W
VAIYSDLNMELSRQTDGDITKDIDVRAIFNSLKNIVFTIQGERRMRPDFAYGPYNFIFESITPDNAQRLGEIINSAIGIYESRISVTNTNIEYDTINNQYTATISFVLLGRPNIVENISFILKRL